MDTIQIIHNSFFGYRITNYLKQYFKEYRLRHINIFYRNRPVYRYKSTTYFIIKSRFLTSSKMNRYLKQIRAHSERANIIIIGSHINYEELYRNHYRVFGVIDTTENKSLTFIKNQIHFYLESLYCLKNV